MGFIVILTGIFGFICSAFFLNFGLNIIWLRYGISVILAYCIFIGLIRIWIKIEGIKLDDGLDIIDAVSNLGDFSLPSENTEFIGEGGTFGGGGADADVDFVDSGTSPMEISSSGGIDVDIGIDLDELVIILLIITAFLAGLIVSIYLVVSAPTLLAEVILDGALCSGLYHRMKKRKGRSWFTAVLRKTIKPFLIVFIFFIAAGFVIQKISPEAKSLGDVLSIIHTPSSK